MRPDSSEDGPLAALLAWPQPQGSPVGTHVTQHPVRLPTAQPLHVLPTRRLDTPGSRAAHSLSALAKLAVSWGQSAGCQGYQPSLCAPTAAPDHGDPSGSPSLTPGGRPLPRGQPPCLLWKLPGLEAEASAKQASPTVFPKLIATLCL